MTTTRPYRKALDVREALARLGDAAGTQLDETLVTAFIEGIETAAGCADARVSAGARALDAEPARRMIAASTARCSAWRSPALWALAVAPVALAARKWTLDASPTSIDDRRPRRRVP